MIFLIKVSFIIIYQLFYLIPSVEDIAFLYHFLTGDFSPVEMNDYSVESNPSVSGVDYNILLSTQGTGGDCTNQVTEYSPTTGRNTNVNVADGDVRACESTGANHR